MNILLNGSFRGTKSNSNYFLDLLEKQLQEPCERIQLAQVRDMATISEKLKDANALVIGMPLYVDGAPAQVVTLMEELYRECKGQFPELRVYVVSNMGFYESEQIRIQLEVVKNWCDKMGMIYGGGLAIGAGEMMGGLKNIPIDQGPNKQLGEGMKKMAQAISGKETVEDIFVEPTGFSRGMYMLAANMSWSGKYKQNGLKKKDIYRRY